MYNESFDQLIHHSPLTLQIGRSKNIRCSSSKYVVQFNNHCSQLFGCPFGSVKHVTCSFHFPFQSAVLLDMHFSSLSAISGSSRVVLRQAHFVFRQRTVLLRRMWRTSGYFSLWLSTCVSRLHRFCGQLLFRLEQVCVGSCRSRPLVFWTFVDIWICPSHPSGITTFLN